MRKTIFTLGLMLAAALSLTNCTKNEEATFTPEVKVPFELYANMDDTRTTNDDIHTNWAANDEINVFHAVAGDIAYENDGSFSTENGDGKFKGTLSETLDAGSSYDWYAFYPYVSHITTPANTTGWTPIGGNSGTPQVQNGNDSKAHIAGKNYPLYGVAKGVAASAKPSITMSHASSLVEFVVKNGTGEDFVVESIAFTAPEDIVGTYCINFASEPVVYKKSGDDYVSSTATLTVDGGTNVPDAGAKFYMGIKPFTAAASSELTVNIETDKGTFAKTITLANATTFSAGKIKTLTVNVNELTGPDAPESNVISTIANLTAGQYYMAAYLVSNGSDDWTATPYHLWNGEVNSGDLVTVNYSFNDNVLATSSSDSAAVVTLEAVADKDNTYYVKCGDEYLYSTATATNRKLALSTDPAEWVATNNANGGITLSSNSVYLGTANASSKLLRSYQNEGTLNAGVYFFAVDDVVLVLPPSITAENISGVAAEGVTDATTTFTSENLTEAITVTCDGTVVTAATVAEFTITYSVSENTTELTREGWIKLAANGVEKTITVSQLAPISGDTATATINFNSTGNRTSFSTELQVWQQNGITVTNNKASSTSNVGNYSNPARFYANSELIVTSTVGKIVSMVFNCYGEDATKYLSGSYDGATLTSNGATVTVTLATPSESFTFASLANQVRVNSIDVTYLKSEGGEDVVVKQNQSLSFAQDSYTVTLGDEFTAPTATGASTTVSYESSNTDVATVNENTGAVTLVGVGTTTIKATAIETDEYYGAEASYTLTVNPAPVDEGDVTTITMETFSAASAAMNDVISYACDKGGGTSNPFITQDGKIRLYQKSDGTGGGYITITAKEGYTISSVTIGSSSATTVAHTIGDSTTKSAASHSCRVNR